MYLTFYGLREAPFELTANPDFLFYTAQHREAFCNLEYGLSSAKPMTLLVGAAGTGKTTLLRAALKSPSCQSIHTIFIDNPTLTRSEFVATIANQLQLGGKASQSKTTLLKALEPALRERRVRGQVTAMVIDEAQSLSDELLEEIRLLANIETQTEKLLPVVLAGQPQLAHRLNNPSLQQLKQRIALRCQIGALNLEETAAYIASRIRRAGGETATLFTREAVQLIHKAARGIPRVINVLCENALLNGSILRKRPVDRETVLEVCRDFDLEFVNELPEKGQSTEPPGTAVKERSPELKDGSRFGFDRAPRRRGLFALLGIG